MERLWRCISALHVLFDCSFDQSDTIGGFPFDPIMRLKGDNANGFIASPCMFMSINHQRDYPEMKMDPIDIGYVGRHYVIDTLEGLEKRVINNAGGFKNSVACRSICARFQQKILKEKWRWKNFVFITISVRIKRDL
jgi:hypothetical protein